MNKRLTGRDPLSVGAVSRRRPVCGAQSYLIWNHLCLASTDMPPVVYGVGPFVDRIRIGMTVSARRGVEWP